MRKKKYQAKGSKWFTTCLVTGCSALWCSTGYADSIPSSNTMPIHALKAHIAFLSADALEGRLTGSQGEQLATRYVAEQFKQAGLEPAGDQGTFFQSFDFTSGVSLGKNNTLSVTDSHGNTKPLRVDKEWRPLSFSNNQSFNNREWVFAGYGISAPALGQLAAYDSYHQLDVKNKWVMVFRYLPERINDDKHRQLLPYASLRYKAFIAKEKGAKGIVFVSGPNAKVKNELIPLSLDTALSNAGMAAISITNAIGNEWLVNTGFSLKALQDQLDTGQLIKPLSLTGIRLTGQIDIQQKKQRGRNVLAKLTVGKGNAPMIVVGAHVDHLGRGELSGSRSNAKEVNRIHPGADDNASGVASVLAVATQLSQLKQQGQLQGNRPILFAIWSGEELGLLGSTYFVKHLNAQIDAYLNLDMVGRLRKQLILQGMASSLDWDSLIKQANIKHALPLLAQNDPYLPTDSTAFYLQGIPAITLFTGSHEEYHTPNDNQTYLNTEGIQTISAFLADLLLTLESIPHPLRYQRVADTAHHARRRFSVYLGTIPDYASADNMGVKLAGVTTASPADRAGLKQGDVIVTLAGKKIVDIYDYTFVLSVLRAGEPVALVAKRGPTYVALTIVPQPRE